MITRNVMWRENRLVPSRRLNALIKYTVFKVAQQYGIQIHALVVMSNHWHAVLCDTRGNYPKFLQDVHSQIGRQLGASTGEVGGIWDKRDTNVVHLADDDAVVRAIAYVMANPVAAHAVKYGRSWPGVRMAWPAAPKAIARPRGFFRPPERGGQAPNSVLVELARPSGFDGIRDDELASLVATRTAEFEREARTEAEAAGRKFMGRRAVLRQSRHSRPTSRVERFALVPTIKTTNRERRLACIAEQRQHAQDYGDALARWRAGERDVVFPFGTYKMAVLHGVRVAPPPLLSA